jgi:hypothetical protein
MIYTLNVSDKPDGYAPELRAITYPFIKNYADKIGAEFFEITERKWPEMPPVYEKFQIYELSKTNGADWNIFIDADTLIHPECPDFTPMLNKDTVCFHAKDFTPIRFRADKYFLRDGRFIGEGNWFAIASDWCTDLWHPLDAEDNAKEIVETIYPTVRELGTVIKKDHLIDDWLVSRNISRYGLKHKIIIDMLAEKNIISANYLYHEYTIEIEVKEIRMRQKLNQWGIESL